MAGQRQGIEDTRAARSTVRRRGMIAAAAALVAGVAVQDVRMPAPVGATDGLPLIVGQGNATSLQTSLSGSYQTGGNGNAAMFYVNNTGTGTSGAIQGNSAGTGYGVVGSCSNGSGLLGTSDGGIGVTGTSLNGGQGVVGRYGSASTTTLVGGVVGTAPTGGTGVLGVSLGNLSRGVFGQTDAGKGVYGEGLSSGSGVYGTSQSGIGVFGVNTGGGMYPYGVVGALATPGFALYGVATVAGAAGFAAGGQNGAYAGQFSGQTNFFGTIYLGNPGNAFVVGPGVTKNAAVQVADGSHRLMHCVEAPEPWFEDFGEGTLTAGKAEVKLDATFASTIDTSTLHIFFTSHDTAHTLHLTGRSTSGFSVSASPTVSGAAAGKKATDLAGAFTWRVVAKRKDVSGERLAKFDLPKEIQFAPPPIPPTPPPGKK